MAKRKVQSEEIVVETVVETAVPETPEIKPEVSETNMSEVTTVATEVELIEVPAKICVQIGLRKRYFATREEALAALNEFNAKQNKPKGTGTRTVLTAEQKAAKAAQRNVLLAYAEKQGKEGKNAAALANTLEDIIGTIPALFALIEEYNGATVTPDEQAIAEPVAVDPSADPLAEFGI